MSLGQMDLCDFTFGDEKIFVWAQNHEKKPKGYVSDVAPYWRLGFYISITS